MDEAGLICADEASRLELDCLYAARTHFVASGAWKFMHYLLGIPAVVLAALLGTQPLREIPATPGSLATLSLLVAGLTAAMTFLDPNSRSAAHRAAGVDLNDLRRRARIAARIKIPTSEDPQSILDGLATRHAEIMLRSPHAPTWAYFIAKLGIQKGQADYDEAKSGAHS